MPIWGWIRDAVPGSRPSSFQGHEAPAVALISLLERLEIDPDKPVSFAQHIQPLFREMDRRAMSYAFDLWDADSVRSHAERIMGRLQSGAMPVDGPWPPEATMSGPARTLSSWRQCPAIVYSTMTAAGTASAATIAARISPGLYGRCPITSPVRACAPPGAGEPD